MTAGIGIGCVVGGIVFACCGELTSAMILELFGIAAGMLASRNTPPGAWQ